MSTEGTDTETAADPARAVARKPFAWTFTTPLYVGAGLNPVNSSIIATALVPIATELHVAVGSTAVLVSSLYLASAVAQPTAGKLRRCSGRAGSSCSGSCWCCSAGSSAASARTWRC